MKRNNSLFPCLHCPFKDWKFYNISAGCCGVGEMCALPVLSMVRLLFLLPIPTEYSYSHKSLKLFGTRKAIAVIHGLFVRFWIKNSGKSAMGLPLCDNTLYESHSFINALSIAEISASPDVYRSTLMCKSYFSRSSMIFFIMGEALRIFLRFHSHHYNKYSL